MAGPLRIGIVGAGPRGLTVLERLVAHTAHAGTAAEAPTALRTRRLAVGLVLALAVLACAFFWPVWTGTYIPREAWELRMWNATWV